MKYFICCLLKIIDRLYFPFLILYRHNIILKTTVIIGSLFVFYKIIYVIALSKRLQYGYLMHHKMDTHMYC